MKNLFKHPFIWSILLIFILIFANNQGWLGGFSYIFFQATSSTQKSIYRFSLKIDGLTNFLFSIKKLEQENTNLKQANQELLSQISQLKEVVRENEFLRQQLGLFDTKDNQLILAHIISQSPSNLERHFLIDQGVRHGIENGDVVITAGNLLVGQIIEVSNSFSMVRLIVDPNSRINALIQETNVTGLVRGIYGMDLILDLLPQGRIVKKDETVVTSGLAGVFPPGLLIGQIQEIISAEVQVSQVAKIKTAIDFEILNKVFIIKKQ